LYPAAYAFLRANGQSPDHIPVLQEHRRFIQRVNTQLWAFATTHSVVTLADMQDLVQREFPEHAQLGPIFAFPAALEICRTSCFHPRIVACFAGSGEPACLRMTHEEVLQELMECVCRNRFRRPAETAHRWWDSVFAHHLLLRLGDPSIPRQLDRNNMFNYSLGALAPYGIRINGFGDLIKSVNDNLRPENLSKASSIAQECLNTDVKRMYTTFAEEFFDCDSISAFRAQKSAKVLQHLGECASRLYEALNNWATTRGLTWPPGHLNSLVSFGQFLQQTSRTGPFRSLLQMVLVVSNRSPASLESLVEAVLNKVFESGPGPVVDLTDTPETPAVVEDDGITNMTLTDVVNELKTLLEQSESRESDVGGSYQDEGLWKSLANLESRLLESHNKSNKSPETLLALLAKAAEQGIEDLPKVLYLHKSATAQLLDPTTEQTEGTTVGQTVVSPGLPDPFTIHQFIAKLTWVKSRSVEDVCQLVSSHFQVARTDNLEQIVRSLTMEFSEEEQYIQEPVLYHQHLGSPLAIASKQFPSTGDSQISSAVSWSVDTSVLFTQRDGVLEFLAACPALVDLAIWSQWYMPGMLFERWGDLEQFLVDCGQQKVCEKYNILALRLLGGGGLLRLTTRFSPTMLQAKFLNWTEDRCAQSTRDLCDLLLGCTLRINRSDITKVKMSLVGHLSKPPGSVKWLSLVYDILLFCPLELLGVLFASILVPCLDEAGLRSKNSWANDLSDVVSPGPTPKTTGFIQQLLDLVDLERSHNQRFTLTCALGSLGLQLGWPSFVTYFEEERLKQRSTYTSPPLVGVTVQPAFEVPLLANIQHPLALSPISVETDKIDRDLSTSIPNITNQPTNMADRETFITELRRREFGCGAELTQEAADLVRRVEGKLSRSLLQLSEDLYGLPGHFLLELIQNADDNEYTASTKPTLEFCIAQQTNDTIGPAAALLVMNNEAIGFTEADMSSLCDVGISRKGIGFKSVFNVTDAPEVHSNGFHVRFHRQSRSDADQFDAANALLLVPEWCTAMATPYSIHEPSRWPIPISIPTWCKTLFVLPIISKSTAMAMNFGSILQLAYDTLAPYLMLFLRRLQCLTLSYGPDCKADQEPARRKLLVLLRDSTALPSTEIPKTAEIISVTMIKGGDGEDQLSGEAGESSSSTVTHRWFCFKETLRVNEEKLPKCAPTQTELALAVSLTDSEPLPQCPVFAYLPVRAAGFAFYINADFDLTSSREDVDGTSVWNQWLVSRIPTVWSHMIEYVLQLPEDALGGCGLNRHTLLCRFLVSLPFDPSEPLARPSSQTPAGSSNHGGLFLGLPAQLRSRLSQLPWLPAAQRDETVDVSCSYVTAGRLLLSTFDFNSDSRSAAYGSTLGEGASIRSGSSAHMMRLLMNRLDMYEPHPDLLGTEPPNEEIVVGDSPEALDESRLLAWQTRLLNSRSRCNALLWLGAQTISVDSLLELVSNLSAEELSRPGLLGVLLMNFESCLSAPSSRQTGSQMAPNANIMLRRRLLAALRHLAIFPLTNGQLVRCGDSREHGAMKNCQLPVLLPPAPSQVKGSVDLKYAEYIQLVSKLGPLVSPLSFHTGPNPEDEPCFNLPDLLTLDSPQGIGLRIALPEVVLSDWILPGLAAYAELPVTSASDAELINWVVLIGQLYVSCGCLCENAEYSGLPTRFPIATATKVQQMHILPALSTLPGHRRSCPVFLPPTSFTIRPNFITGTLEELETKLFRFFLDQLDESDPVQLVAAKYFENLSSSGAEFGYRCFRLFSEAGSCTLLSVHSSRYFVSSSELLIGRKSSEMLTTDASLLPLPPHHRLRKDLSEALIKEGLPQTDFVENPTADEWWIVEDFVSPGVELLLSWITRLADRQVAAEAAYQLACLLHDNWSSFENVQYAWYSKYSAESQINFSPTISLQRTPGAWTRSFGHASWLHQLRQKSWLPVEKSVTENGRIDMVAPAGELCVYSPGAFADLRAGRLNLVKLLLHACHIWAPGPYIVRDPPFLPFTTALGLVSDLTRTTFEVLFSHLMNILASQAEAHSITVISQLTPELMVQLYRLALNCLLSSDSTQRTAIQPLDIDWLRKVFATPGRPCLLVACCNQFEVDRSGKRPRLDNAKGVDAAVTGVTSVCPICSCLSLHNSTRKRHLVPTGSSLQEDLAYHFVEPGLVAWDSAKLPQPDLCGSNKITDDDEDAEFDSIQDQCFVSSRYVAQAAALPRPDSTTKARVFSLSRCYGLSCRTFFVDYLGIASTSSVGEVLTLRPEFSELDGNLSSPTRYRQWLSFGRRLGQWYALLHYCLLEDGVLQNFSSIGTNRRGREDEAAADNSDEQVQAVMCALNRFPLLFGADGQWWSPADVATLSGKQTHNASRSTLPAVRSALTCLFAWSKWPYGRLVETASSSGGPSCRMLAHSLDILNARHRPGEILTTHSHASSDLPSLPETFGDTTRPVPISHNEGTAHGLLLDVLGLPVIDQLSQLRLDLPDNKHSVLACTSLSMFFNAFLRIVTLWTTATSSSKIHRPRVSEDSLTDVVRQTAFLVDHLAVALQIRVPVNVPSASLLNSVRLGRRLMTCVIDNLLYLDSTLGADLFARLSALPISDTPPLVYLCIGLLDDSAFEVLSVGQTDSSVFSALADYICPHGGTDRTTFTHFMQGLLNMAGSLVPDLHTTLGLGVTFSPNAVHQLENYLVSHGIRKPAARRTLRLLCTSVGRPSGIDVDKAAKPSSSQPQKSLVSSVPSQRLDSTASQTSLEHLSSETSVDHGQTTSTTEVCTQSSYTQIHPGMVAAYTVGSSTRNDTIFGSFRARVPFSRLTRHPVDTVGLVPYSQLWSSAPDLPSDVSERLRRMLRQSGEADNPTNLTVGRMGEFFIYQRLMDLIERNQQRHHNFDQISDLEFPTGHPALGSGRVVRCHWCNADLESRRPFDLEVDVQVECDASQWDEMLESVQQERAQNVVRIAHAPSRNPSENRSTPGLLSVGPIYLEVKSTARSRQDSATDLFEMSVSEILCASQQGWRYHLLRVVWDREDTANNSMLPSLTAAPFVTHVPALIDELRDQSPSLQLCLAMLRSPC
ncbi:hypothetical protein X801_04735, partial [Opisthorchis viverrini]